MCFAQETVSYVQNIQKGNITSTDTDITCTRLGVVFLIRRPEHRPGSSYPEFPLGEHSNAYVKDSNFFLITDEFTYY